MNYVKKLLIDALKEGCWYRRLDEEIWWRRDETLQVSEEGNKSGHGFSLTGLFSEVETKPYIPEKRKVKRTFYRAVGYSKIGVGRLRLSFSHWYAQKDNAIDAIDECELLRIEECQEEIEE